MPDEAMDPDHVYQIIVTFDVSQSSIAVSCGGLAPQLVRVALETAADFIEDFAVWTIAVENAGAVLQPAIQTTDDEE